MERRTGIRIHLSLVFIASVDGLQVEEAEMNCARIIWPLGDTFVLSPWNIVVVTGLETQGSNCFLTLFLYPIDSLS